MSCWRWMLISNDLSEGSSIQFVHSIIANVPYWGREWRGAGDYVFDLVSFRRSSFPEFGFCGSEMRLAFFLEETQHTRFCVVDVDI